MDEICMYPECGRKSKTRGLCLACYRAAAYLVKTGTVSWEQLEKDGKCKASVRRGRRGQHPWFTSK